jgi:hypothetical protein
MLYKELGECTQEKASREHKARPGWREVWEVEGGIPTSRQDACDTDESQQQRDEALERKRTLENQLVGLGTLRQQPVIHRSLGL